MTIAQAFNDIAVAQGGTASKSGTIAGAIDALNDALAGSDQQSAQTIEDAVRLLGQNIGGGSSVTVEALTATENKTYTAPSGKAYSPVTVNVSGGGGSIGNLNGVVAFVMEPQIGNYYDEGGACVVAAYLGEQAVFDNGVSPISGYIAAGLKTIIVADPEAPTQQTVCDMYLAIYDDNMQITSLAQWSGTLSSEGSGKWSFIMPEPEENKGLLAYLH